MKIILYNPDCTKEELKTLLFQGKIIRFTNNKGSMEFAQFAIRFLRKNLKTKNLQEFEHTVSIDQFFRTLSNLKSAFSLLPTAKNFMKSILDELAMNINANYFDLVRLRSISSYLHKIEAAKPAFAIHRDTWYANPEAQINYWIPLFDVTEYDTFSFYPSYFSKPVKNNSNQFDYKHWKADGGFQSSLINKNRIFPELQENIDLTDELRIPCHAGDLLLFSASHLHGTSANLTSRTRFSLDFRTVDIEDIGKYFAPNIDNESKGSILTDMISAKTFRKYQS
jgi:hypothetical protein